MPDLRGEGVCVVASMPRGCWGVLGAARGEEAGVDIVPGVVSLGEGVEEAGVGDVGPGVNAQRLWRRLLFVQVGWRTGLTAPVWCSDVAIVHPPTQRGVPSGAAGGSKFLLLSDPIERRVKWG
jgi:hypothetical protein